MQETVYRVIAVLCAVVATVPIGTNLGQVHLLWMLVGGRLLETRGAVIPGPSAAGLSEPAARRAWAAWGQGNWTSTKLLTRWGRYVEQAASDASSLTPFSRLPSRCRNAFAKKPSSPPTYPRASGANDAVPRPPQPLRALLATSHPTPRSPDLPDTGVEETADNFGGPTQTHALLFGSPAVDAGNPGTPLDGGSGRCVAADQRGVPRTQDGDNTGGGRCDIGAFELLSLVVNATDDDVDAAIGYFACATAAPVRCTLRATVQEANAVGSAAVVLPASGTPYTLPRPGLDATALNGDLDITGKIAIIGGGATTTIIDGNRATTRDRVFEVAGFGAGNLQLSDLTVRGGDAAGSGTERA